MMVDRIAARVTSRGVVVVVVDFVTVIVKGIVVVVTDSVGAGVVGD